MVDFLVQAIDNYDYAWSDFVGNIGVALLIGSFYLNIAGKIDSAGFWYSFNNMVVAILLGINLYYKPNISSILIEIFWFGISVYGLVKWYRHRAKKVSGT